MRPARTTLLLALSGALLLAVPQPTHASPDPTPVGDWQGTLTFPGGSLLFVMHVMRSEDGTLSATLDSPDQGEFGIPTGAVTFEDGILTVDVPQVDGTYRGRVGEDRIDGTWSQHGQSLPLDLEPMGEGEA